MTTIEPDDEELHYTDADVARATEALRARIRELESDRDAALEKLAALCILVGRDADAFEAIKAGVEKLRRDKVTAQARVRELEAATTGDCAVHPAVRSNPCWACERERADMAEERANREAAARDAADSYAASAGRRLVEAQEQAKRLLDGQIALTDRIRELEAALRPFAEFAEQWDRSPLRSVGDEVYSIHSGAEAASIRLSDCRAARKALAPAGEESGRQRVAACPACGRFICPGPGECDIPPLPSEEKPERSDG